MECSQKLCATFWGFPVTNSPVFSLLKRRNISVPSSAVLLLDLRSPHLLLILKNNKPVHLITIQIQFPHQPCHSLFFPVHCIKQEKRSNHLQIKSIPQHPDKQDHTCKRNTLTSPFASNVGMRGVILRKTVGA